MSLILRLIVIALGFAAACAVAGAVIVVALLFPELSSLDTGAIDSGALNMMLGFGFIFVSGFALLPALVIVLLTETFAIQSVLTYAVGGAVVGAACYLGLVPFDPGTLRFEGLVQRHLEIMTGAGILGGVVYWVIAGRNAGAWRTRPATPPR